MTIENYTKKHKKHKEYVERRPLREGEAVCMLSTTDEWYPNYDGNFVQVSLLKLRNSPKETEWRVCVWGADDFGLEKDTTRENAVKLYREISKWEDCTQGKLRKLGFYNA